MTGEGMWLDTQHGEMIQGSFDNGTVTGVAVWERQDGVRFEGVFRRGHAHGPGLVTWYGDGYRWAARGSILALTLQLLQNDNRV